MQPPPGLPQQRYLKLTKNDALTIEKWLTNKLGEVAIRGQRHNLTTNRCEASHLTVLKSNPKCRNHPRNFSARSKSAAHSMSLGVVDSVIIANKALSVENSPDCPADVSREQLRQKEKYYKRWRQSKQYKKAKAERKARSRRIRERYSTTGYSKGVQDPVARHDHGYNV